MTSLATSLTAPRNVSPRRRQFYWTMAALLLLVLSMAAFLLKTHYHTSGAPITPSAYRKQLEAQVETTNGAPINGRDPASQLQTSLASAANAQDVIGKRVAKPAAKVVGTVRHTDPTTVLPDTKKTHILASGCLLGYGVPGVQCVPAKAPKNQPLSCDFIHTIFPKGVQIFGADYLNLGKGTSMACATNIATPKG